MKQVVFETDWLASRPVFYNDKTGQASHNINDVIDLADVEIDPEGFSNYLDFGYSVFGLTPVRHVRFLRYSSRLLRDDEGGLHVEELADPVDKWWDYHLSEADIVELIRERVRVWERSIAGDIIIPTSGGYDSRLLNWAVGDKSRIRSFTYGLSLRQEESVEVIYAKRLAEVLGTRWTQIPLGHFLRHLEDWVRLYGVSTHAHGMYHMEFYRKIRQQVMGGEAVLSGIFGDVWAGSTSAHEMRSESDLPLLGHTHGLRADLKACLIKHDGAAARGFWERHREGLRDSRYQVLTTIRLKMILISYLMRIPEWCGLKPWSPFLDIDVCMAMLNLPQKRRALRVWQQDFFARQGLALEAQGFSVDRSNVLNQCALRRTPPALLDAADLSETIDRQYVGWINGTLQRYLSPLNACFENRLFGGVLRRMGRPYVPESDLLKAYFAYCVLFPLAHLLSTRHRGPASQCSCSLECR